MVQFLWSFKPGLRIDVADHYHFAGFLTANIKTALSTSVYDLWAEDSRYIGKYFNGIATALSGIRPFRTQRFDFFSFSFENRRFPPNHIGDVALSLCPHPYARVTHCNFHFSFRFNGSRCANYKLLFFTIRMRGLRESAAAEWRQWQNGNTISIIINPKCIYCTSICRFLIGEHRNAKWLNGPIVCAEEMPTTIREK